MSGPLFHAGGTGAVLDPAFKQVFARQPRSGSQLIGRDFPGEIELLRLGAAQLP